MTKENNYNELSDIKLVELIHAGDLNAQEFIISKFKNLVKIKAHAYFIIGADKEDIVQEGMIGLFKAIRDFDSSKNTFFYSFAELCINRQIITAIKSATRQKHIPLNSYVSLNNQVCDGENENTFIDYLVDTKVTNPEELIIDQEEKNFIENHINEVLSEMECRVLALYLKGKSYEEIAKQLSKEEKSVDNALQRVRKKIEKILIKKN